MSVLLKLVLFPIRVKIPPYIQAKILSLVNGSNLSNIYINTYKLIVPIPENPPDDNSLGSKNNDTAIAIINEPRIVSII